MNNDLFERAPVPKAYMTLALPVALSMLVSLVYNMADTYFIAKTGSTALVAGVSLTSPMFTMMIAFGDIWGLGGSSLISRLFGAKRYDEARRASSFAFWASIAFGFAVTALLLLFRSPMLSLLGATSETLPYAREYYTWIVLGAPAIILGLVPGNILRTEGLARQSMRGSVIGSVANVLLDPLFIFVFGMGAAGAAIATVLGNLIADAYYVYVLLHKSARLSVDPREAAVPLSDVRGILAIGIPASVTNLMQSLMVALTNQALLPYGTQKIAALGLALKVNMISSLIIVGFAFGGQPLAGYCWGARDRARLTRVLQFAYSLEIGLAAVMAGVLMLFSAPLIDLFMSDAQIVADGARMLRFLQAGLPFMAVVLVSICVCQSFGQAGGAFVLSVSRQGVVYALVLFLLPKLFGFAGILASAPAADFLTAAAAVFIVRSCMKKMPA